MKCNARFPAFLLPWLCSMAVVTEGCTSERNDDAKVGSAAEPTPKTLPSETQPVPPGSVAVEAPRVENVAATVETLLQAISTSGLTFIRNGSSHTGAAATAHIRGKYDRVRDEIKTPEEFIAEVASRSSLSGKPYLVQFADGTRQPLGDWLSARLAALRAEHSQFVRGHLENS